MVERISLALALALVASLAACYGPNAPYGAPCAMDVDCPSHQSCDLETSTCGPPTELQAWRDDTAADFGAAGAYTEEVTIEQGGFVGPAAYFAGGVRLSGIDRNAIPDPLTPWNELAGLPRTGTTYARGLQLDFPGAPLGLGLAKGDDITVLVEGEVYLDAPGRWRFELTANDVGFLELAPPASSSFVRVITDQNSKTDGLYDVPAAGWYRLRGAFADAAGTMGYELRYDSPGPGNLRQIPAVALRAPAGDVDGMIVDGFENPYLIEPTGSVLDAGTLGGLSLTADPFGLPVGSGSYSLRFAAQVLIDVDGSYALRIASTQGHRAWIDGRSVADKLDANPQTTVTTPVPLEPGWHDLVVDLNRVNGTTTQLDVTVASGPVWVGQPIPLDHLRPVVGRATRWAAGVSTFTSDIPDGGTSTRTVSVNVQPDLAASSINLEVQFNHPDLSTMEIKVTAPTSATATIVAAGSLQATSGTYTRHATMPASTAGSVWSILATDTALEGATGTLVYAAVTILGAAGPAPFAPGYRYVSAPHDLGQIVAFAPIRWSLRQAGPAAKIAVSLRSCDAAATCADEPWTAVAEGASPVTPPRRFAQYMIELTGTDDVPAALDWIEIGYRAPGAR